MNKEEVDKLLRYEDGKLYWRHSRKGVKDTSIEAGSPSGSNGRRKVMLDGEVIFTHRLVFLMHYGHLPEVVDHIDGDVLNNNISNLRAATIQLNNYNRAIGRDNTSGIKGVSWHKRDCKWIVQVGFKGSRFYGRFDDVELAELVATEFRDKYHGEFAKHR